MVECTISFLLLGVIYFIYHSFYIVIHILRRTIEQLFLILDNIVLWYAFSSKIIKHHPIHITHPSL